MTRPTSSEPPADSDRAARAAARMAARRRHVRRLRLRVLGVSTATFAAASGAVLVQLVTGHDPALARTATTTHVTTTAHSATASRTITTGTDTDGSTGAGATTSTGATSGSRTRDHASAAVSPSAVTTRAS